MRAREGEALRRDLNEHLDALAALRDQIALRAPQVPEAYRERLTARLAELPIPIIASGGAGSVRHIADVLTLGRADAALAASIFHYNEIPIPVLKRELSRLNINVRQ